MSKLNLVSKCGNEKHECLFLIHKTMSMKSDNLIVSALRLFDLACKLHETLQYCKY